MRLITAPACNFQGNAIQKRHRQVEATAHTPMSETKTRRDDFSGFFHPYLSPSEPAFHLHSDNGIIFFKQEIPMLTSIQGIYRKGKVELIRKPKNISDETSVIVTFLDSGSVDLRKRGINKAQAKTLRAQLATFAEDWDSPEMNAYDNYDDAKSHA
jgi:hypothetical protein